jgi:hypothetical protein
MSTKEQLQQEIDRLREQLQVANATVKSASASTSASVKLEGAPPPGGSLKLSFSTVSATDDKMRVETALQHDFCFTNALSIVQEFV